MSELTRQHEAHLERIARLGGVPCRRAAPAGSPATAAKSPLQLPVRDWLHVASTDFDSGAIPVRQIMVAVCARYGLTMAELVGTSRTTRLAHPRHIAMYLARRIGGIDQPSIAAVLGERDQTTVSHGVRKIEGRRSVDAQFDAEIAQLEALIRAGESPARFSS
jgi:Bacterial dnaA protein helix-turn-helix